MSLLFIVLAALFGGSVPPIAKIALEVMPPFTLVFTRFFFATLILLPFVLHKKEIRRISLRSVAWVGSIGAINPIMIFIALLVTQASVSPFIYASVPAMTALYGYFATQSRITSRQIGGIIIGLMGVGSIILYPLITTRQIEGLSFAGNALIFVGAIAFMFYGIVSKNKQREENISPLTLTFAFSVMTLLISLPFALNDVLTTDVLQLIQTKHLLAGVYVGLIGTSLFYLTYQYALKHSSAVIASLFTYLQPVVTVSLAVVLIGEKINAVTIGGGILAIIGAQLASSQEKKNHK